VAPAGAQWAVGREGSVAQVLVAGLYASTVFRALMPLKPPMAYTQVRCRAWGQGAVVPARALRTVGAEGRVCHTPCCANAALAVRASRAAVNVAARSGRLPRRGDDAGGLLVRPGRAGRSGLGCDGGKCPSVARGTSV
jgi:hypothetical protein